MDRADAHLLRVVPRSGAGVLCAAPRVPGRSVCPPHLNACCGRGYDAFEFSSALLTGPYATLNFTLVTLVLPPFWIAVSLVIFWRRSDDWMALIVALFLVMLVTIFSPALSALSSVIGYTSPLGMCITLLQLLAMSSFGFFIALFPDGRFVPGWTRWLTLTYLLVLVCLPSTSPYSLVRWPPVLLGPLLLGLAFAWGFAQLYRYRR